MFHNFRNVGVAPLVALVLGLVAWSAALAQQVKSTYQPGIDFSKYRTYQWVETRPHPDPKVDAEIKRSIDSQLTAKGLTRTENKADLTLDYHVAMSQEEQWSTFRYNEIDTLNQTLVTVYGGTLGVDIRDSARNQVVWEGLATKAVDPGNSFETKKKILDKAVKQLLKGFPPKPVAR
jgi:hypothetical protein